MIILASYYELTLVLFWDQTCMPTLHWNPKLQCPKRSWRKTWYVKMEDGVSVVLIYRWLKVIWDTLIYNIQNYFGQLMTQFRVIAIECQLFIKLQIKKLSWVRKINNYPKDPTTSKLLVFQHTTFFNLSSKLINGWNQPMDIILSVIHSGTRACLLAAGIAVNSDHCAIIVINC